MITKQEVLRLHKLSIAKYDGAHGVRDHGLLESAIARPFQTFDGEELYPTTIDKASAVIESIIINHPFIDGNKRTGFLTMFAVLQNDNIVLTASEEEVYSFVISISTGEISFDAIVEWLRQNSSPS